MARTIGCFRLRLKGRTIVPSAMPARICSTGTRSSRATNSISGVTTPSRAAWSWVKGSPFARAASRRRIAGGVLPWGCYRGKRLRGAGVRGVDRPAPAEARGEVVPVGHTILAAAPAEEHAAPGDLAGEVDEAGLGVLHGDADRLEFAEQAHAVGLGARDLLVGAAALV